MTKLIRHYPKDNPDYFEFVADDVNGWYVQRYCCNCDAPAGYVVVGERYSYCPRCGEKIDWGVMNNDNM